MIKCICSNLDRIRFSFQIKFSCELELWLIRFFFGIITFEYFQGLPLVILFQPETKLSEKDSLRLREEGQNLADSLQCPFLDEDWDEIKEGAVIEDSLRALVESIKHRSSGILSIAPPLGDTSGPPDLRVIMCLHCGDPFNIEAVLGPLLGHSSCHQSGDKIEFFNNHFSRSGLPIRGQNIFCQKYLL